MNEPVSRPKAKPQGRRVGTVTVGVTLVIAGCAMLVKLFFPDVELAWMLRLSPAILIGLGIETLLASRSQARLRYDWAGILLCFLTGCAGLAMTTAAWYLLQHPECFHC